MHKPKSADHNKSESGQPDIDHLEPERAVNADASKRIQQSLYLDDHHMAAMPRDVMLKVGAFLTNLMCKNLKYKIGKKSYLLLKP